MYAVIQTGGKQYRVQPGDIIAVEKLEGDVGSAVKFDQVLLVSQGVAQEGGDASQLWVGKPTLSGASVDSQIVAQGRGEKILIIKMKRRKQYRRTQGHRQDLTQLLVTGVTSGQGPSVALTDAEKKEKMTGFHTQLRPKGPASTLRGSITGAKKAQKKAPKKD